MSNIILSPNMSLPVPIVSVDPGPDWANNINGCLSILDQHTHSHGSGVQITQSGINLTPSPGSLDSLSFNFSNAYSLRSTKFVNQISTLGLATDVGCLYESGSNLYFNNGAGTPVQITSGNSIVGTAGSITGLPSGTASASYSGGTFIWQSATSTSAAMDNGPVTIRQDVASANGITLQSPNSLSGSYSITLPTSLPGATSFLMLDNSGNMSASNTASTLTLTTLVVTGTETVANLTATGPIIAQDYVQFGAGGPEIQNASSTVLETNALQFYLNSSSGSAGLDGTFGFRTLGVRTDLSSVTFPIVVSATPSTAGLMIVRGYVSSGASSLASGEGASVSYSSGTSHYTVTFTTAFIDTPAVSLTVYSPGSFFTSATLVSLSSSGFVCAAGDVSSGFSTRGFTFVAIGQRGA